MSKRKPTSSLEDAIEETKRFSEDVLRAVEALMGLEVYRG